MKREAIMPTSHMVTTYMLRIMPKRRPSITP
jgi:hypothetical protein